MDILIQSALERTKQLGSAIHIRYSDTKARHPKVPGNADDTAATVQTRKPCAVSYVIIYQEYSYLEPIVRAIFNGAEDVQIVVDRRWHNRCQTHSVDWIENRRNLGDRRRSVPMLDILINLES